MFGEHLQVAAFDENYFLTEEGEILEVLVDVFWLLAAANS